ncbi:MAG: hypothetical protein JSS36_07660 [Proteobacteria bacterium]|nr:hypothetical protein [Pseudomonadota bacterium]
MAYAPAATRGHWLGLLALDARLAGVVRGAREPILGQLRLAWWRERLGEDPARWPTGEPLLAQLRALPAATMAPLVDGWEALLLGEDLEAWLAARPAALAALHAGPEVARLARGWALGELAGGPEPIPALIAEHNWRAVRLPRTLRPLLVLHHFARRAAHGQGGGLLGAMRLGLIGQ